MKKKKSLPRLSPPPNVAFLASLLLIVVPVGVCFYATFMVLGVPLDELWVRFVTPAAPDYFTKAFPIQAGLLLIALIAYLLFASALRRYRRWVDSGQDYRLFIQKAGSLEDLTSPKSIAKLSNFPEFQKILRAWADRMQGVVSGAEGSLLAEGFANMPGDSGGAGGLAQDISAMTSLRSAVRRLADVKAPLTRLNAPGPAWKDLTDEIRNTLACHRALIAEARRQVGQSPGLENLGEKLEDLLAHVDDLRGTFDRVSTSIKPLSDTCVEAMSQIPNEDADGTVDDRTVQGIQKVVSAMKLLGERNEKIALNLALKAQRGECSEAAFSAAAEEVRKLAEKFKTLAGMTEPVLGEIQKAGGRGMDRDTVESILMGVEEGVGQFNQTSVSVETSLASLQKGIEEMRQLFAAAPVSPVADISAAPQPATASIGQVDLDPPVATSSGKGHEWGTLDLPESDSLDLSDVPPRGDAEPSEWKANSFGSLELQGNTPTPAPVTKDLDPGEDIVLGAAEEMMEGSMEEEDSTGTVNTEAFHQGAPAEAPAPSAETPSSPVTDPAPDSSAEEVAGGVWIGFSTPDEGGDESVHDLAAIGAVEASG